MKVSTLKPKIVRLGVGSYLTGKMIENKSNIWLKL